MKNSDARFEYWSLGFILVGWIFVFGVVWSSGLLGALKGRGVSPEGKRVHFNVEDDPKIGSVVSLPAKDIFGRDVRSAMGRGRNLVVYCGSCSGCSMKVFDYRQIETSSYGSVILVFRDEELVVREKVGFLKQDFYIVLDDESGRLWKYLNAVWTPRFFLVDGESRLLDYQRYVDDTPGFLKLRGDPYVSPSAKEVL